MATRYVTLTDSWQQIATGVSTVQVKGGTARIHTGTAIPPEDTDAYFDVDKIFSYSGNENVYAKYDYKPPIMDVGVVVDDAFST